MNDKIYEKFNKINEKNLYIDNIPTDNSQKKILYLKC